jgi:hypothetical protein
VAGAGAGGWPCCMVAARTRGRTRMMMLIVGPECSTGLSGEFPDGTVSSLDIRVV